MKDQTFVPALVSPKPALHGFFAAVPAILACSLCAAAATAQTISAVPVFPGGSNSAVYAVNANGTAAAGYSNNAAETDTALRWVNPGGSVNLGLLPSGSFNSYAQAIDSTGTILAGYGDSAGNSRAFRWTTGGGYQVLPLVTGTGSFAEASGISAAGNRVVGTSGFGSLARAFLWDASNPGVSTNLGVLPSQPSSGALAISGDGNVVVGSSGPLPFRWTQAGGMQGLGASLPGQLWAMAEAVNTDGSVITGRYSTGNEFGYRWTAATGMVALPPSPGGSSALRPRAINGDGTVIIGQVVDGNAGFTAFIWTPAMGTQLLSTHLSNRSLNVSGWQFTDATGISADGSAMCGTGIFNGQAVGWVIRDLPCTNLNSPLALFGNSGCIGGTAIFDVNFSFQIGTAPVFRWWKDGVLLAPGLQGSGSILSNYNSNQLTITNMQPADAGNYQVGISAQGACEVVSAPLAFAGPALPPQIVVQPVPTSACVGQSPFLFSVASSPFGAVDYRWQRFNTNTNTWVDIFDGPTGNGSTYFGTATSTFSFFNAQTADSANYRCRFSVAACPASTQVLSDAPFFLIAANTTVIEQPQDTSACLGGNAAFSITASPINDNFTYQWQKKNPIFFNVYNDIFDGPTGNGGSFSGTQTANLSISGVFPADLEYYRCVVTGTCQSVVSNDAYLSEASAPFVLSGPDNAAACQGTDSSMSVNAVPLGSTYQWQKYIGPCILCWQDLFDGPTGNGGTFSGTQSPTLTINTIDLADTFTTYRCLITGPCGGTPTASPEAAFTLLDPPLIQSQPVGGPVCPSGSKQLTVTLAPGNYGTITYQWWRFVPDFPIFAQVPSGTLPSGATAVGAQTATLTLSNFKQQDAGQYYCTVTGACAPVPSSVVTLTFCIADFDCSGTVAVPDIFAFLAAWFAQSPSADVDGNPGVTVPDIFAFLSAWFAGCP